MYSLDDTELNPKNAVMVGDGMDDHRASAVAGTGFIAALYGFGIDREYCNEKDVPGISDISELRDLISQRS